MALYVVQFDVASGETGQLVNGATVDLEPAVAERLLAAAPGALKPKGKRAT